MTTKYYLPKGQSFSIVFAFNEEYDTQRIEAFELTIGGVTFRDYIINDAGQFVFKLSSSQTNTLTAGDNRMIIMINDEFFGVLKKYIAELSVIRSLNSTTGPDINTGLNMLFALTVMEQIIDSDPLGVSQIIIDAIKTKTAYQYAVDGGYTGTEEQFYTDLGMVGDIVPFLERAEAAAESAEEDAAQTAADRLQTGLDVIATGADRVQTGLDVVQTGEDRVQTGLDAQATAADRIQTGLDVQATAADVIATGEDRLQTAADRVQTGLDAQATSADRVQTGLDAQATAADRVQTGLDVIQTAADRVQTGLDVIATAADRVQTGLDVVSADAAAELAEKWAENPEDVPVETGKFSALHWSAKAEDSADSAQASADVLATGNPIIPYRSRVAADSGLVKDIERLNKLYAETLQLNLTADITFDGFSGYKLTTGKLSKFYNTATNADYSATAGAELTVSGLIAPNEMVKIKGLQGETGTKTINGTSKAFAAGASWTMGIMVAPNRLSATATRIYTSASNYILISNTAISYVGDSVTVLTGNAALQIGLNTYIEFQYSNGLGLIKVNNVPIATTTVSGAISVDRLSLNQTSFNYDGTISFFTLLTGRISEDALARFYSFIRSRIPTIEFVAIGNQAWATSNWEGITAGDGTQIAEVQDPAVWATATTIYNDVYAATSGTASVKDLAATKAAAMWGYYNNLVANGAIYGRLYNWYAVRLISIFPPDGYRVPLEADFMQLRTFLGGTSVAGGKLKKEGLTYWASPNTGATNESGFSAVGGGYRNADGGFINILNIAIFRPSNTLGAAAFSLDRNDSSFSNSAFSDAAGRGLSLRLLRNSPVGDNERRVDSGVVTANIASTPQAIAIPFGYTVRYIRITNLQLTGGTNLTNVSATIHNAAGTSLATLITGKTVNAASTMVFPVLADHAALLQDGQVRVLATGNLPSGMTIEVILDKTVL